MNPTIAHRFETEFVPRIAQVIVGTLDTDVNVDITPYRGVDHPTTLTISAAHGKRAGRLSHALNVSLTWDAAEITDLMGHRDPERFARYLHVLPRKLKAWQEAREFDFVARAQAEPTILLGNLDFSG
jgi:hypothetical protein